MRATVSASSVIALSGCSIEPCPAVPRAVSRIQAMPFSAIWISVEAAAAQRDAEPADLADRLGDALEQAGVVVHQPARPVGAAGLLVGQEGQHHVARRAAALAHPLPDARRASSRPCPSCPRRRGPRRSRPVISPENGCTCQSGRVGRDHIQVPVDEQGGPGRVLARDPGDDAGPALIRLEDGRLEADVGEQSGDVFGGLAFAGAGVVAPVGGVDPDQVAAQGGDLVLRGLPAVLRRLRSASSPHRRI